VAWRISGAARQSSSPHQIAGIWIAGNHHWAEFSALHHPPREWSGQLHFFVSFSAGLMTARTSPLKEPEYIFGEALCVGSAQLTWCCDVELDQPSGSKRNRYCS
jgi:hypothetical protein